MRLTFLFGRRDFRMFLNTPNPTKYEGTPASVRLGLDVLRN